SAEPSSSSRPTTTGRPRSSCADRFPPPDHPASGPPNAKLAPLRQGRAVAAPGLVPPGEEGLLRPGMPVVDEVRDPCVELVGAGLLERVDDLLRIDVVLGRDLRNRLAALHLVAQCLRVDADGLSDEGSRLRAERALRAVLDGAVDDLRCEIGELCF